MKSLRLVTIFLVVAALTACHPFGTSNLATPAPLPKFTPKTQATKLWAANTGSGTNKLGLRFAIGYADGVLFTTDSKADVTATNAKTGRYIWYTTLPGYITAGVGVGDGIAVLGTDDGYAVALDTKTGNQKWKVDVGNQMLAVPQIQNGVVIIKTVADTLYALDAASGRQLWSFVSSAPTLILRFGSTPQIAGNIVYVGMASGRLSALNLQMGTIRWQQQIAVPHGVNDVQQMVDIDADPILQSQRVYVATYQGRIAALNMENGEPVWTHNLSTYTGLVADGTAVYVTDAKGYVWAFAADTGRVIWCQKKLRARVLTAPILMGDNIVVADAEGYAHWINKQTGQFIAQAAVQQNDAFASKPVVVGDTVYFLTNDGELLAYRLGKTA